MTKNLNDARILLVDDEHFIRQLVSRLLRDMDVKDVQTADDGEDAVKKLQTYVGRIDLVILDLEMPNMNGFQVTQAIRDGKAGVEPDLPILILTGHGQEDAVKHAVDLGIHGFMVKPMSRDTLEKGIRTALSGNPIDPAKLDN